MPFDFVQSSNSFSSFSLSLLFSIHLFFNFFSFFLTHLSVPVPLLHNVYVCVAFLSLFPYCSSCHPSYHSWWVVSCVFFSLLSLSYKLWDHHTCCGVDMCLPPFPVASPFYYLPLFPISMLPKHAFCGISWTSILTHTISFRGHGWTRFRRTGQCHFYLWTTFSFFFYFLAFDLADTSFSPLKKNRTGQAGWASRRNRMLPAPAWAWNLLPTFSSLSREWRWRRSSSYLGWL